MSDQHITFAFILSWKLVHENFGDHSESCLEAPENSLTNKIILSETFKVRWDDCTNFDEKFSLLSSELYKLYDSRYPIRTKVVSNNRLSKPRLTPDIMIFIKKKILI